MARAPSSGKQFIVFIVSVRAANGAAWTIFRRYSQFKALSDKINAARLPFGNAAQVSFPPKKTFGAFDPNFINQRSQGISRKGRSCCMCERARVPARVCK